MHPIGRIKSAAGVFPKQTNVKTRKIRDKMPKVIELSLPPALKCGGIA